MDSFASRSSYEGSPGQPALRRSLRRRDLQGPPPVGGGILNNYDRILGSLMDKKSFRLWCKYNATSDKTELLVSYYSDRFCGRFDDSSSGISFGGESPNLGTSTSIVDGLSWNFERSIDENLILRSADACFEEQQPKGEETFEIPQYGYVFSCSSLVERSTNEKVMKPMSRISTKEYIFTETPTFTEVPSFRESENKNNNSEYGGCGLRLEEVTSTVTSGGIRDNGLNCLSLPVAKQLNMQQLRSISVNCEGEALEFEEGNDENLQYTVVARIFEDQNCGNIVRWPNRSALYFELGPPENFTCTTINDPYTAVQYNIECVNGVDFIHNPLEFTPAPTKAPSQTPTSSPTANPTTSPIEIPKVEVSNFRNKDYQNKFVRLNAFSSFDDEFPCDPRSQFALASWNFKTGVCQSANSLLSRERLSPNERGDFSLSESSNLYQKKIDEKVQDWFDGKSFRLWCEFNPQTKKTILMVSSYVDQFCTRYNNSQTLYDSEFGGYRNVLSSDLSLIQAAKVGSGGVDGKTKVFLKYGTCVPDPLEKKRDFEAPRLGYEISCNSFVDPDEYVKYESEKPLDLSTARVTIVKSERPEGFLPASNNNNNRYAEKCDGGFEVNETLGVVTMSAEKAYPLVESKNQIEPNCLTLSVPYVEISKQRSISVVCNATHMMVDVFYDHACQERGNEEIFSRGKTFTCAFIQDWGGDIGYYVECLDKPELIHNPLLFTPSPTQNPTLSPTESTTVTLSPTTSPTVTLSPTTSPTTSPEEENIIIITDAPTVSLGTSVSDGGNSPFTDSTAGILAIIFAPLVFIAALAYMVYVCVTKRTRKNEKLVDGDDRDNNHNKLGVGMDKEIMETAQVVTPQNNNKNELNVFGFNVSFFKANPIQSKKELSTEMLQKSKYAIQFKDIKLGEMIGRGSFGSVFEAELDGATVAVKEYITRKGKKNYDEKFVKEFQALEGLKHPNIVKFYGIIVKDEPSPTRMIVMERAQFSLKYVLQHINNKNNPKLVHGISLVTLLQWAQQICSGCEFIHSKKLIHFDLKPDNVLIDFAWNVKLCDLASSQPQSGMRASSIQSTPAYTAPELLTLSSNHDDVGNNIDIKKKKKLSTSSTQSSSTSYITHGLQTSKTDITQTVDVYSFGMILWNIFHPKQSIHPKSWSHLQFLVEITDNDYRPKIDKNLPKELSNMIAHSWNKEYKNRPDFQSLFDQIDKLLGVRSIRVEGDKIGARSAFELGDVVSIFDQTKMQFINGQYIVKEEIKEKQKYIVTKSNNNNNNTTTKAHERNMLLL